MPLLYQLKIRSVNANMRNKSSVCTDFYLRILGNRFKEDLCVAIKSQVFLYLELGLIFPVWALNRVSVFICFVLKKGSEFKNLGGTHLLELWEYPPLGYRIIK